MKKYCLPIAIAIALPLVVATPKASAQSAQAYFEQAFQLMTSQRFAEAESLLAKGLALDPNNGLGHYYYAEALWQQGKSQVEALKHYKFAAQVSPDTNEGRTALQRIAHLENRLQAEFAAKQAILDNLANIMNTQGGRLVAFEGDMFLCGMMVGWSYNYDSSTKEFTKNDFTVAIYGGRNGSHWSPRQFKYSGAWESRPAGKWALVFKANNYAELISNDWFAKIGMFTVEVAEFGSELRLILDGKSVKMGQQPGLTKANCAR
jgi:tetratricopeptide (TPR) repeat protein